MLKKLIRYGNAAALVIDRPLLEMLDISLETSFELNTDGKNIILSPQIEYKQEVNVRESLARINKTYGNVLEKLGE